MKKIFPVELFSFLIKYRVEDLKFAKLTNKWDFLLRISKQWYQSTQSIHTATDIQVTDFNELKNSLPS